MRLPRLIQMLDEEEASALLTSLGMSQGLLRHCEAVRDASMDLADRLESLDPTLTVEERILAVGALCHDLGRLTCHSIQHGIAGARMVREMNVGDDPGLEKIALICERHLGGGIAREEAVRLGLPDQDFLPVSLEEKIIAYCDNLVDDMGDVLVLRDPDWAIEQYARKHGPSADATLRVRDLNLFFERLLKGQ